MAHILIVDDEESDRVLEGSFLRDSGHELRFAKDGSTALQIYEDEEIDLVITDLVMPELNGLRLIRALIELDESAKIIAISGLSPEQLPLAEDLGAVVTLTKPVSRPDLEKAVDMLLDAADRPDFWR